MDRIKETQVVIYEVVRIIDGKILFLEDHYERFILSIQKAGIKIPNFEPDLVEEIQMLIEANKIFNGNIKYQVIYNNHNQQPRFVVFPLLHSYPTDEQYTMGVNTITFTAERPTPNAKIQHSDLRVVTDELIQSQKIYEVILVHPNGYITEGSRTNLFMIQNNQVYTAPEEDILKGITRKYIFNICHQNNIPIIEERVPIEKLQKMEALFLTGTSPKVLPVNQVNQLIFSPKHPILKTIMEEFELLIKKNLKK